jgi:hypothetical protein
VTDIRDDELDELMRDWAARQAAPDRKLDDLVHRIGERLTDMRESDDVVKARRQPPRRNLRWAVAGGAIASSLAVLIYVIRPFNSSVSPETNDALHANRGDADINIPSLIGDLELSEKARLARELQQEFPGRFAWLMENGDEMKLGLSEDESTRPSRFVAVRYVIETQGPDDRVWKAIRTLDFITQSEETVQTSLASNHGASVAIWTYTMPDGMISVDSELVLSGPVPIHVSSNRLLSAGAPAEIWQSERDGVKYRVYQAAEILGKEHLG